MNKVAVSVTLAPESIAWLRARTTKTRARSLSEALDRLIQSERSRESATVAVRSVVGLVRIPDSDPNLDEADAAIRSLFSASASGGKSTRRAGTPQPYGRVKTTGHA